MMLLICSSFSRENGHILLICSSPSTAYAKKNAGFHSFKAVASVASACKGSESVLAAATTLEKLLPFKMACNFDQKTQVKLACYFGASLPAENSCLHQGKTYATAATGPWHIINKRNKAMNESSCWSSCVSKISMKKYEEPSQLPVSHVFLKLLAI